MNESKVHYQEAWPPILHAAALWLNAEGFENAQNEVENISKGKSFEPRISSRLLSLYIQLCISLLEEAKSPPPQMSCWTFQ